MGASRSLARALNPIGVVPFPGYEHLEGVHVAPGPCAVTVGNELVPGDFDEPDIKPACDEFHHLVRFAFAPDCIGIGRLVFDHDLQGLLLGCVLDVCNATDGHVVPPSTLLHIDRCAIDGCRCRPSRCSE
jgi:hypothetical protein